MNCGKNLFKLSVIQKSLNHAINVIKLIIPYNTHISSTDKSFDNITFIIYQIGAIIKEKRYNQNHFFINFSAIEFCWSIMNFNFVVM
jgi:hypothetical protein